jgi:two-component system phosphate regulon response regulator PhoB
MADNTSVLVVEDEPAIVELVKYSLREAGWDIRTADTVGGAWDSITRGKPDLVLLDWMLPDQSGLRLLSRLRGDRDFQEIPVIMLTAKSMEEDKIAGLNTGADDYVTKPFSPRELLARSRALLRRKSPHLAEAPLRAGSVVLDPNSCTVSVENGQIEIVFMAKAIERIGDHAKNVAEAVVQAVKGTDVRHQSAAEIRAAVQSP